MIAVYLSTVTGSTYLVFGGKKNVSIRGIELKAGHGTDSSMPGISLYVKLTRYLCDAE